MASVYDKNTYKMTLLRVVDGDTLIGEVDLGFGAKIVERFRLAGINTPEITGIDKEAGMAAKVFVEGRLVDATEILVTSRKTEKYGRYLATIFYDGKNLNEELVLNNFAMRVMYQ